MDLPGTGDTSIEFQYENQLYFKSLFKRVKKMKILLVIIPNSNGTLPDQELAAIKFLANQFSVDNLKDFANSVYIIFNRVENLSAKKKEVLLAGFKKEMKACSDSGKPEY